MCTFNNPPARFLARTFLDFFFLFATRTYVSCEFKLFSKLTNLIEVVAFVKTQILFFPFYWFWSICFNIFKSFFCKLDVVTICTVNCDSKWYAFSVCEYASLYARFCAVCRVLACFFPRQEAPLSWRHPC